MCRVQQENGKKKKNPKKYKQKKLFLLNIMLLHFRVRVTDRHCRHLRRKIKFGTKNHKLAKKISPELPTTESYNCRACLSHLDCIIRQLATQLSIRKRELIKLT